MMQIFEDVDHEHTGMLDADQWFSYFEIDCNAVLKEAFMGVPVLNKTRLYYHEFLACLYCFCTLPKDKMAEYVFQTIDEMGLGIVDREVVYEFIPKMQVGTSPDVVEETMRKARKVCLL